MTVYELDAAAHAAAAEGDAEWFERNPGRRFRIRAEVPGERGATPWREFAGLDPPGAGRRVVVATVPGAGVRLRVSLDASLGVPPGDPGDEVLGRAFLAAAPPPIVPLYLAHMHSAGFGAPGARRSETGSQPIQER